jgi:hypothetical protein
MHSDSSAQRQQRAFLALSVEPALQQASLAAAALQAEIHFLEASIQHERDVVRRGVDAAAAAAKTMQHRAQMELPQLVEFWLHHNNPSSSSSTSSFHALHEQQQRLQQVMADFATRVTAKLEHHMRRLRVSCMLPARTLRNSSSQILSVIHGSAHSPSSQNDHRGDENQSSAHSRVEEAAKRLRSAKHALLAAWDEATSLEDTDEGAASVVLAQKFLDAAAAAARK